jgi:putative SOS response-associated peptidase YedK
MIDRFVHAGADIRHGDRAQVTTSDGTIVSLRWGILAPWRGHGGKRPPPIHVATLDTVAATPVLRDAMRCLVHADGFYVRAGARREPYVIHPATELRFAAIHATHRDDGIDSFALLVGPAPAAIASLTTVAPLVALDAVAYDQWRASPAATWNPSQGALF